MFSKLVLATVAAVVSAKHQPLVILMSLNEDECPCPHNDLNCMYAYPEHCNVDDKCPCPEGDQFCYSAYPKHCVKDELMQLSEECPHGTGEIGLEICIVCDIDSEYYDYYRGEGPEAVKKCKKEQHA